MIYNYHTEDSGCFQVFSLQDRQNNGKNEKQAKNIFPDLMLLTRSISRNYDKNRIMYRGGELMKHAQLKMMIRQCCFVLRWRLQSVA